jgi:hypothetical protein
MMIGHDPNPSSDGDQPFVFAGLFGWTCSICAPLSWPKERVEEFACQSFKSDGWQAVNKTDLGLGDPTPNPCDQAPSRRQHWFLLREDI